MSSTPVKVPITGDSRGDARRGHSSALQSVNEVYNAKLRAPNVWEVPIPFDVIEDAKVIFDGSGLREAFYRLRDSDDGHLRVAGAGEVGIAPRCTFFALRSINGGMGGSSSDITWASVDDQATYDIFARLFERLHLEQTFAGIVRLRGHKLRMYSAFYVVRSRCTQPHFHVDYENGVGVQALTLMTPLAEYRALDFQLLYGQAPAGAPKPEGRPVRYTYRRGTGITFGALFRHSTEPGTAHAEDGLHVYLCFTFGTDQEEDWPAICRTIGQHQSRVLSRPDGQLVLTELGKELRSRRR